MALLSTHVLCAVPNALALAEAARGGHRTPAAAGGVENPRWQVWNWGNHSQTQEMPVCHSPGDWREPGWIGSLEEGSCCSGRHLAEFQGCQ